MFDVSSEAPRLLRVFLDLIVSFRIVDDLVTIDASLLWVMDPSPLPSVAVVALLG